MDLWTFRAGLDEVVFGSNLTGVGLTETPDVRSPVADETRVNPRSDGRRFGRDTRPGSRVLLDLEFRPEGGRSLDRVMRDFSALWRGDAVRSRGGEMAELVSHTGRTAFGRPREVVPNRKNMQFDVSTATTEFECVDDLWYGAEEELVLRFTPEFTGGLPVPAEVPFVLGGGTGSQDKVVTVAGDVETWPVFEIHGPIMDPFIDVPGVGRLQFTGQIAYDRTLIVDTRHWRRSVRLDSVPAPGFLAPAGSRLSDMSMAPGAYRVIFGGYDPSGTSSMRVRVRPAFVSF